MSETPRRRGRPKGTGIDDSTTLRTISSLLAANADLKPTTAIRRSGVTDPSIVRRLREKLKLVPSAPGPRSELPPLAPRRPIASPVTTSVTSSVTPLTAKPSAEAAEPSARIERVEPPRTPQSNPPRIQDAAASVSAATPPRAAEPVPAGIAPQPAEPQQPQDKPTGSPAPTGPKPNAANEAPQLPPPDPQLEALRLAADAAGAMSRLYLHCINHAAQTSPLNLALSSQAMMSQWFSNLMSAQIAAQRKPKP
jgi:hypothetical protein